MIDRFCRFIALGAVLLGVTIPSPAAAEDSFVTFMYHRFGENGFPSTNTRLDQLDSHIRTLQDNGYSVVSVADAMAGLAAASLPDRTIVLTVDDGYRSVFEQAWPRLKQAGFPVTVYVSTQAIDAGYQSHMTWDMIRRLVKEGVEIGGHTVSHGHLTQAHADALVKELEKSAERYRDELGFVPKTFAYPYGEASLDVQKAVRAAGYELAFGQHSGAIGASTDRFYLPRFALNERYGSLDRFTLAANSVALDVNDITPMDMKIDRNPPAFGFTLSRPQPNLACYPSDGNVKMTRLGGVRYEVRFDGPVSPGRLRINCTALRDDGRWYWFGMQYYVPEQ